MQHTTHNQPNKNKTINLSIKHKQTKVSKRHQSDQQLKHTPNSNHNYNAQVGSKLNQPKRNQNINENANNQEA